MSCWRFCWLILLLSADLTWKRLCASCVDLNQAEMGKLSAEVAQQRPLWEQSKQVEEVHHAEIAEVSEQRSKIGCGCQVLCVQPHSLTWGYGSCYAWMMSVGWHGTRFCVTMCSTVVLTGREGV